MHICRPEELVYYQQLLLQWGIYSKGTITGARGSIQPRSYLYLLRDKRNVSDLDFHPA